MRFCIVKDIHGFRWILVMASQNRIRTSMFELDSFSACQLSKTNTISHELQSEHRNRSLIELYKRYVTQEPTAVLYQQ
jgi:hypothetical protein